MPPAPRLLTKYEAAHVVAARSLQLSVNASPLVHDGSVEKMHAVEIALLEMQRGDLSFQIHNRDIGCFEQMNYQPHDVTVASLMAKLDSHQIQERTAGSSGKT